MDTAPLLWCARLDSNQRPSGSKFPDTQRQTAISSRFSSVAHKVENHTKSPRSLFRTGFAGFCMRGGQMVVAVVDSTEKTEVLMYKGNQSIICIQVLFYSRSVRRTMFSASCLSFRQACRKKSYMYFIIVQSSSKRSVRLNKISYPLSYAAGGNRLSCVSN